MYKKIPTYDFKKQSWEYTSFETREKYVEYLWSLWKEPGKYEFDESSLMFNEQARNFNRDKIYTIAPNKSKDFITYWETEKEKCRNGVIIINGNKHWFLSRSYYMWLNFLPLYNKETSRFSFPDVRDAQYHMALYEELAEQTFTHAAILKKRQIASSYFHAGKMINLFYFEEGATIKIAASLKDYISEKGTWRFLEEYRNFLNTNTAWYRPCNPDKIFNWEQKIEVNQGGKKRDVGLKSVISGLILGEDPTNGVGGPCLLFFHEEGGLAPKMNLTFEYMLPALKSGMRTTGLFIAAGSVGDLDQCEPLRKMIENPGIDILGVETNLIDDKGTIGIRGLFIPEQWSMLPCIDKYGNSLVEEALEMIKEERILLKKELDPATYQLRISQKPTNIAEAFASRKDSRFPQHLVTNQIRRIEDKTYFMEYVDLEYTETNEITIKNSNKLPINEFPLSAKSNDKEGVVVLYERPVKDIQFGMYYASVDPVSVGKTTTSNSLCSIIIYKTSHEITNHKANGEIEHILERDKIVASWCGRFEDLNKTHERLLLMIELYQAWTIVENNVFHFIQYMIEKKKQKYLVPKNQILFLKELQSNNNVFQEYGWRNTGSLFKDNLIPYGVQFCMEVLDTETKPDGEIVKTTYGVERIPDIMLLKEMQAYHDGLNVDRLISFCSLIAFAKVQESNRGYVKVINREDSNFDKSNKNTKFRISPFRHIGNNIFKGSSNKKRSPFKNLH